MSRKLPGAEYERLKREGADLIEDYGLAYPLDLRALAAAFGAQVIIHPVSLPPDAGICGTTDGFTEVVTTSRGPGYKIHMNGARHLSRQRFTLMHELAHIWLNHLFGADASLDTLEAEANFFANYVLAPDALVIAWCPGRTVAEIASVFQMSDDAARIAFERVVRATQHVRADKPHDRRIRDGATLRTRHHIGAATLDLGTA